MTFLKAFLPLFLGGLFTVAEAVGYLLALAFLASYGPYPPTIIALTVFLYIPVYYWRHPASS